MKKCMFCVVAICCLTSFLGCNRHGNDVIWDFANFDVCVIVNNSNGDNLLDPGFEGNILGNDITVDYDAEVYTVNDDGEVRTRYNLAMWRGLRIERYYGYQGDDGTLALKFGEFQTGSPGYHGEIFTINWGDGTSDEIKFDLYVTYDKKRDPTVHQKIWLNGVVKSEDSLKVLVVK